MTPPLTLRRSAPASAALELSPDLMRIVQLAADLVNSQDRTGSRELIPDAVALAYVVSDHPWPIPAAEADDLASAHALRAALTGVFANPRARRSQHVLDVLLAEHPPTFELRPSAAGAPALVIGSATGRLGPTLCAQMSLALSAFLRDGGAARITGCDGPGCVNVAVQQQDGGAYCSPHCATGGLSAGRPTPPPAPGGRPGGRPRNRR